MPTWADAPSTSTPLDADNLNALEGGEARCNTVADAGSAETLPGSYVAHDVTMTEDCTFTFPSPGQDAAVFSLLLSGAYTPTFPASVDWDSAGSSPG